MTEPSRTVLILDDDDAVRESLAHFLEDRGWQVSPAESAEQALQLLTESVPECAIVDIRLPGIDGNEFLRIVNRRYPNLACVICTGSPEYSTPEDILAFDQVSTTIFTKPVRNLGDIEYALLTQMDTRERATGGNE